MTSYTFPFDTCEKPSINGIAQPYSVFFNVIICLIIVHYVLKTKNNYAFFLLSAILLFEGFHTCSHAIHLNSGIQTTITHLLAYLVNFAYFIALYNYSGVLPDSWFIAYLAGVVIFDIYAFTKLSFMYYLTSQFAIFFSLFIFYYSYFTDTMKARIPIVFSLVLFVLFLFLNESLNCAKMLSFFPNFPFHILIEMSATVIAFNIGEIFYQM
jgi:hypothetical protein